MPPRELFIPYCINGLSLPSWKSTSSQPYTENCEEVIIGSIIIFHLLKLWKATFFMLHGVTFLVRPTGEIWNWSLLGVKGLITILHVLYLKLLFSYLMPWNESILPVFQPTSHSSCTHSCTPPARVGLLNICVWQAWELWALLLRSVSKAWITCRTVLTMISSCGVLRDPYKLGW